MTQEQLNQRLATPSPALVEMMAGLQGDLMILGAGGKMGPTLCLLAQHAVQLSGVGRKVIAVSRFSEPGTAELLRAAGVEVIAADLMEDAQLDALPDCPNVIYMVGRKFGTTGREGDTWAMNVYLPGRVAQRFCKSRIVVFSSGNIYPYMPGRTGGATPETPLEPVGEYAITCLGRERVFEYFSQKNDTPMAFYRLNYAIDLRYGVLHDICTAVWQGQPVAVGMGSFNCIWQGDANEWALRLLPLCEAPGRAFNITGPERISIRETAHAFGRLLGREVIIEGEEGPVSALNNAADTFARFGYPQVTLGEMMEWTADWVKSGGASLGKPTHFEVTTGKY